MKNVKLKNTKPRQCLKTNVFSELQLQQHEMMWTYCRFGIFGGHCIIKIFVFLGPSQLQQLCSHDTETIEYSLQVILKIFFQSYTCHMASCLVYFMFSQSMLSLHINYVYLFRIISILILNIIFRKFCVYYNLVLTHNTRNIVNDPKNM